MTPRLLKKKTPREKGDGLKNSLCRPGWPLNRESFISSSNQLSSGKFVKNWSEPCERSSVQLPLKTDQDLWDLGLLPWHLCTVPNTFHCNDGWNSFSHQYEEPREKWEPGFPGSSRIFSDLYLVRGGGEVLLSKVPRKEKMAGQRTILWTRD